MHNDFSHGTPPLRDANRRVGSRTRLAAVYASQFRTAADRACASPLDEFRPTVRWYAELERVLVAMTTLALILREHPLNLIRVRGPGEREHQKNSSLLRAQIVTGDRNHLSILGAAADHAPTPCSTCSNDDGTHLTWQRIRFRNG